jgi:hypothetical protein
VRLGHTYDPVGHCRPGGGGESKEGVGVIVSSQWTSTRWDFPRDRTTYVVIVIRSHARRASIRVVPRQLTVVRVPVK